MAQIEYRATVSDGAGTDFVLSDGSLDRHGTRINPDGWDLAAFKRNPIALFGHNSDFPIGRWENVRVEGGKLVGKLVMAARGTSARIDELLSLVEQGILRGVSVGFAPLKRGNRAKSQYDFEEQTLLEASLVSVPSNPNTLAAARGLGVSSETLSLAFGEHAETGKGDVNHGGHAERTPEKRTARVAPQGIPKMNLSQRIEAAQSDLNIKRDKLVEISAAEAFDVDAVEELNSQVEAAERALAALKASEARIGTIAAGPAAAPAKPGYTRHPLGSTSNIEIKAADLIFRSALCHFVAKVTNRGVDQVVEDRYPGHEATSVFTRADATIATTTTSGWASQLVQNSFGEFLDLLSPDSVYPGLKAKGIGVTFSNNNGSITIPSVSTDAALAGGFVLEGDPIPVGRLTTASISLVPHKFGILTTMSKEAAMYSTPALEGLLRRSILRRTAITLDGLLLDATAGSTTRPAGLLNGVSAAASGVGGGDYLAVLEDIAALMAPFDTANAGRNLVLIMHPAQARKLAMMPGPDGTFGWADRFMSQFTVLTSTSATANRLIAIDAEDFCAATGDTPMFDVSEQATLHMSDAPGEIVTAAGSVNDPIRSMWQTNSIALRMVMNLTWKMRRTGMVQWIDGTSW